MTEREIISALCDEQKKTGIPWTVIAERSGVAVATIYFWQSGERHPSLTTLLLVADALGLEITIKRKIGGAA